MGNRKRIKPLYRIALCGYSGEHSMPGGWIEVPWKTAGGYGSQGNGQGRANAARERIWFSPHCSTPKQMRMFYVPNQQNAADAQPRLLSKSVVRPAFHGAPARR